MRDGLHPDQQEVMLCRGFCLAMGVRGVRLRSVVRCRQVHGASNYDPYEFVITQQGWHAGAFSTLWIWGERFGFTVRYWHL